MDETTIAGCKTSIFGIADKPLPFVYLPTFANEGLDVWQQCNKLQTRKFVLVAIEPPSWNDDLTPWAAPSPVLKEPPYSGKGKDFLHTVVSNIIPQAEQGHQVTKRIVAGYSLAGLWALWSCYQTDSFDGVVSGSGSFWYPNFMHFVHTHQMPKQPSAIYMSLGDKERFTKQPLLAQIEELTLQLSDEYLEKGINAFFQLNNGNHYNQTAWRMAKGIQWMMKDGLGKSTSE